MKEKALKFYEQKAKALGKMLLVEDTSFSTSTKGVEFSEKIELVEDTSGKKLNAFAVAKNVPVSRYTENANGRVYSRKLWEKVCKEKQAEGTLCLADHPEEDGSVKDIVGVWHNLKVNEDLVTADLYLVEEKYVRVLKAGGSLGISSVGFGELAEDEKTVIPESFDLERTGDLVMSPSQKTYMTQENVEESVQIKESEEKKFFESEHTNKEVIIDEISTRGVYNMSDKLTESVLKMHVGKVLKEAKSCENYHDAIVMLEEARVNIPSELSDVHSDIESMLVSIREKMASELVEKGKSLKETTESVEELQMKYQVLTESLDDLKDKYAKARKVIKKMKESGSEKSDMLSDIKVFEESHKAMEADIRQFENDRKLMEQDITRLYADRKVMEEDLDVADRLIKESEKKSKNMNRELRERLKHIRKLEKLLKEEYGYNFGEEEADAGDEDFSDNEVVDDIVDPNLAEEFDDVMPYDVNDEEFGYEDDFAVDNDIESSYIEDGYVDDSFEDDFVDDEFEDDFYEEEDSEEDEDEEEMKESTIKPYRFSSKTSLKEGCKKSTKKPVKKQAVKEQKKARSEFVEFYKEAVQETPALAKIRAEILSSKSLYEAARKVEEFRKKDSKVFKMDESMKKASDIKPYVFKR